MLRMLTVILKEGEQVQISFEEAHKSLTLRHYIEEGFGANPLNLPEISKDVFVHVMQIRAYPAALLADSIISLVLICEANTLMEDLQ